MQKLSAFWEFQLSFKKQTNIKCGSTFSDCKDRLSPKSEELMVGFFFLQWSEGWFQCSSEPPAPSTMAPPTHGGHKLRGRNMPRARAGSLPRLPLVPVTAFWLLSSEHNKESEINNNMQIGIIFAAKNCAFYVPSIIWKTVLASAYPFHLYALECWGEGTRAEWSQLL